MPAPPAPAPDADGPSSVGTYAKGYFETRLAENPHRDKVWRHICAYLQRWIAADAEVLELGAGRCDFANNVTAGRVVAMDIDKTVEASAVAGVTTVIGDCTDLGGFEDASFDVVFASNLLEHLERPAASDLGGYFDDFTHVAIYTDRSLQDYLVSQGWAVEHVEARFLPLTMKSRASGLTFLVPLYLRSPLRPLAGQMLVVARPSPAGT
jgi:hypothetical protein